jgi:hypothetical protein
LTPSGGPGRDDARRYAVALTPVDVDQFDQDAILKTLNLNPSDPKTQALLLICKRYGLDPLLKHVVLIGGRPYVTRDGYLHIAHSSGKFDGIEIVDEGIEESYWWARASVYRKDMARPFTYKGRYPKKGGNAQYGPEMAIKCAEVMAMRRAFNVTGIGAAEERWDTDTHERIDPGYAASLVERINALGPFARVKFYEHFDSRRPQELLAVEEADAAEFVSQLEAEREVSEVSPGGDENPSERVVGVELDEPPGDTTQREML